MTEYRLTCPNGHEIIGTIERITGIATIDTSTIKPGDTYFTFEHNGYTEVDWDSQYTANRFPTSPRPDTELFECSYGEEIERRQIVLEERFHDWKPVPKP